MQYTSLRTSSSPHTRRGARLILVALLGLLGVLTGCGSRALHGAPANYPPLTPPPVQPTTPVALLGLQMIDATSGWASRGPLSILHTTTGPQHWHDVTPNFHPDAHTAAVNDFLDSQHAWAELALLPGADAPLHSFAIWHTSDGGQHWQPQELPLPLPDALNSSPEAFFSSHNGLDAIMPTTLVARSSTFVLYVTHDGGATWNVSIPTSLDANSCTLSCSFDFVDMQQGWFSGERLYRTEDGGRDFRAFPLPQEASSEGFLHMDFVSPTLGWAISVVRQTKQFLLLQTTNDGQNWTVLAPTVG